MVTSQEILKKTKLKSSKTLTRWAHLGLIPKPAIQVHPSGRGKMAYWPDWVLDRCMKIKKLQREGFSLHSAVGKLEWDRFTEIVKRVANFPKVYDSFEEKEVNFGNGRKFSLLDLFHASILTTVENLCPDEMLKAQLLSQLKEKKALDRIMLLLNSGFNPILVFDGQTLQILPDFILSHRLGDESPTQKPYITVQTLPIIRETFAIIDKKFPSQPNAYPAPKVWAKEGDTIVEYQIYLLGGEPGFELIRESAETVGTTLSKVKKGKTPNSRQEPK